MSKLFSEITIGQLKLDNRIVVPPMCQYSAVSGQASEWHLMHYGNLALSGTGLLIFEATGVAPEGWISFADLGWKPDRYIAPDAPNGWQTFAPSAEPLTTGGTIPKELSRDEIKAIVRQFAQAAKRAVDIGFNLVELHAAYGYLMHQFFLLLPSSTE
jgi:NADH:flavin oxidoreductases, Old Yellow Enzyme family